MNFQVGDLVEEKDTGKRGIIRHIGELDGIGDERK